MQIIDKFNFCMGLILEFLWNFIHKNLRNLGAYA